MSALSKVLVIDDEAVVRDTLGALLSSDDVELLFAENCMDGVRYARRHGPDAIPLIATMVWQVGGRMRIENREDQIGVCVSLTLPKLKTDDTRKGGRNGS